MGGKKAKVGLEGAGGGVTKMKTLYEILKEPMMGGGVPEFPFPGPQAGRWSGTHSPLRTETGWGMV